MRTKDDDKRKALLKATIKLVNEIGFASSSVSKIAKEAAVSPSTLYIYFENKEDLLVATYVDVKLALSGAMLKGFDDTLPIHDIVQGAWLNSFEFVKKYPAEYAYAEQFANSPYSSMVNREEVEKHFAPIILVLQKGIEQKILKDVSLDLIAAFLFPPITYLANPTLCRGDVLTTDEVKAAFSMTWDALKL